MEKRKDSLQLYSSRTPWIEHEIITLLQKLDWQQKEKNVKKVYYRRKTNTFFTILDVFRQQCQRSRSSYRYKEIEEGKSSNSLTTWAKCNVLILLVSNAETNFGRQSLSHHYVPVSTRMRCKSCQRRWKRELFAKDNLSLERTKSNTPKYMGLQNSDVSSMPRETESNLKTWNFDPIPSESRNWPDESLQGQAAHTNELKTSQAWCSAVTDASFHCWRVHF